MTIAVTVPSGTLPPRQTGGLGSDALLATAGIRGEGAGARVSARPPRRIAAEGTVDFAAEAQLAAELGFDATFVADVPRVGGPGGYAKALSRRYVS